MRSASCSLQRTAGCRAARAGATLRSLSLGRRRSTRASRPRAPCCAGHGRPAIHGRSPHRQDASLFRRAAVVRPASCGLQRTAGGRVARTSAPLRLLSLGRGWLLDQAASFASFKKQLSRCTQPESRRTHRPAPVLSGFLPPKEPVGRVIGRCVRRDSGCVQHRERCFLNEVKLAA